MCVTVVAHGGVFLPRGDCLNLEASEWRGPTLTPQPHAGTHEWSPTSVARLFSTWCARADLIPEPPGRAPVRAVFRRQSGPSRTLPDRLRDIRQSSSGLVSCLNESGGKRFSLIETLGKEKVNAAVSREDQSPFYWNSKRSRQR